MEVFAESFLWKFKIHSKPVAKSRAVTSAFSLPLTSTHLTPSRSFEGPGLSSVFSAPISAIAGCRVPSGLDSSRPSTNWGQILAVLSSLAVEPVESFQLTGQCLWNNQVSDFIFTRFVAFSSFTFGGFRALCCPSIFAGVRRFLCCGSAAAACQNKRRCQSQSKQSGDCPFSYYFLLDHRSLSV